MNSPAPFRGREESLRGFFSAFGRSFGCSDQQVRVGADLLQLSFEIVGLSDNSKQSSFSGIGSNGAGFECSIKTAKAPNCSLRYIIDPLAWTGRSRLASDLAHEHALQWGGTATAQIVPLLEWFNVDESRFTGNFRVWLGSSVDSGGATSGKLYFNPYLCHESGLLGAQGLVSLLGLDAEYIETLSDIYARCGSFTVHILGVNFTRAGVEGVKVYLALKEAELRQLKDLSRSRPVLYRKLSALGDFLDRERGEVHLALNIRRNAPLSLSMQFLAESWFETRAGLLKAIARVRSSMGCREGRPGLSWTTYENVSFVGISESADYVYGLPPDSMVSHAY